VDDDEQRRAMAAAMLAWGTDYHFVYVDVAGSGLLVGEAERQGKTVVATELGGGGHVTASTHRIAREGLANVLRHTGVLQGEVVAARRSPPVIGRATEPENFLFAPESGLWETLVELGQRVRTGEPVGRIHFLERPDREPTVVSARCDSIVLKVRAIATTEQGDNVAVVAREIELEELLDAAP
jgi:N-alpha-acetyl-L-2,4-diaminobutyrate deacetylase